MQCWESAFCSADFFFYVVFCFHVVKRGRLFLIRGRYVSNFSYPFVYVMGVNAVVLEVGCRAFIVKAGRK